MARDDNETAQTDPRIELLHQHLVAIGTRDMAQADLLTSYCEQMLSMGVPLMRTHVTMNAIHPVYGSLGVQWQRSEGVERQEHEHATETPENWLQSPFYHMLSQGETEYRERLSPDAAPSRFSLLRTMKERGASDYLAAAIPLGDYVPGNVIDTDERAEGVVMSWMSDAPDGFTDECLTLIRATFPTLALAMRASSNRQTAVDLLGIYLGNDAGRRVLSGEIQRGTTQWIDAVICYFDLEGFTDMSQRLPGEALIAMLNEYFDLVVARIEGHGGNVLKFMGDGLLAIFDRKALGDAPDRAVAMLRDLQQDIMELNAQRAAAGAHIMQYTIALHAGPVLYGNIGADQRLDFTVIGPEVNLGARIGGMHKSLGQSVIISQSVARDVTQSGFELISLGRYMLRGVNTPQELFTLYGAAALEAGESPSSS